MATGFDISRVPKNGYLIFPLSMSRLANAQQASVLYDFLKFFEQKIEYISVDVIFLYTNDLYLSVEERAIELRKKVLDQMLNHKNEFLSILLKEKKYTPQAFHFLPWDYAVLGAEDFSELRARLVKAQHENSEFAAFLQQDLASTGRDETEANFNFLIEEIAISHLLIQKRIPLPHALTTPEGWRLLCYPGDPLQAWVWAVKNGILPLRTDLPKEQLKFSRAFYNIEKKALIDFETAELPAAV